MWFLIGFLLGRRRSPVELERRRAKGHPWLFMLFAGTAATAALAGDWGVALVCTVLAGVLLVA